MTGEIKAVVRTDLPNWSGVLATAGNLVFSGLWEGALVAYDARTLQEVWRFDTGCGVMAPPISYAVNGKHTSRWRSGPIGLERSQRNSGSPIPARWSSSSRCDVLPRPGRDICSTRRQAWASQATRRVLAASY